jgi:adenosylcobinamide kinase/adenosylcobinamide-phosphate guanylyltransferase
MVKHMLDRRLVLVLGGARSGKSTFAERLAAERAGAAGVLYVATAEALDDEMAARIARHRAARPDAWRTLEEPRDIGPAVELALARAVADVVLVDCLTLWVSNLLLAGGDETALPTEEQADARIRAAVEPLLRAHRRGRATTIMVSNEVGMGLVPPYPLGRLYRDLLGRINAWVAREADEVYLLVAGLPLRIKPYAST